MMKIEDFILQRAMAFKNEDAYAMIYEVVQWHKNWPVLIESPVSMDVSESNPFSDYVTYTARQKLQWLTRQEYEKRFGEEAPSSPIILKWANMFSDHPDFQEEWRI